MSSHPLYDLVVNISSAFVDTVEDLYVSKKQSDTVIRQRRLYLALLVILLMLLGNFLFVNMNC